MKNKTWTESEIQLVRDNFLMSLEDLSELVGRSQTSVLNMKYKLKNQGFKDDKNYVWDFKRGLNLLKCKKLYQEGYTLARIAETQDLSVSIVKYYVYFISGLKGRKIGAKRKVIPEDKKIRIRFLKSCFYSEKEIAKDVGIKTIFVKRVIEET